jgi:CSLREA domain-containing protein
MTRPNCLLRLSHVLVVALFGCAMSASAITLNPVDSTGDDPDIKPGDGICGTQLINQFESGGPCTLRAAIQEANALAGADAFEFKIPITDPGYDPQTGAFTINLGSALPDITEGLSITGSDPNMYIIRRPPGSAQFRIFSISTSDTVNLTGITIKGGSVNGGDGGGVLQGSGRVNVTRVTFDTNYASNGGAFAGGDNAAFTEVLFQNNSCSGVGGAIAKTGGGALSIANSTFIANVAEQGGAIGNSGNFGNPVVGISKSTFSQNQAYVNGAAVYSSSGFLDIADTTISNNAVLGDTAHTAFLGGAIYSAGDAYLTNTTVSGNSCQPPPPSPQQNGLRLFVAGAGIACTGSTLNIVNCTILGNTIIGPPGTDRPGANTAGGGIYSTASTTILHSTVANNTLTGGPAVYPDPAAGMRGGDAFGSGLFANAAVSIINSTFAGNTATGGDGGSNPGGAARGGGIYTVAALDLSNTTITDNHVTAGSPLGAGTDGSGGGVFASPVTGNVKSTIIAGNSASIGGPDAFGTFSSKGYNLIGKLDGSTGFGDATDLVGTGANPLDPKLDPAGLQANGGPTLTIALLHDSPAIDHGTSIALDMRTRITDQRGSGFPRVSDDPSIPNASGGDGADIGAFELQVSAASPTPTATPQPTPTATPGASSLGNISTRVFVQTGDNVLIGGFIVTGSQDKKVVVRALGPSLNLPNKLANPILELRDSAGMLLQSNDDWSTSGDPGRRPRASERFGTGDHRDVAGERKHLHRHCSRSKRQHGDRRRRDLRCRSVC